MRDSRFAGFNRASKNYEEKKDENPPKSKAFVGENEKN
jgi:hypothetical protein